jgi:hypothetical protein
MNETKLGELILYKGADGPGLEISLQDETIWMTQTQISELFGTQRPAITKHLQNIYKSGELLEKSVCSVLEHTAADGKKYKTQYYNLDAVLAVGYRVNSKRATQFRIWATQKLRDYLLKGYLVNGKRLREAHETKLKELQEAHKFIRQAVEAKRLEGYEKELTSIIDDYTQTWVMLTRFDEGDIKIAKQARKTVKNLDYKRAKQAIDHFKRRMVEQDYASGTFGSEQGTHLSELLKGLARKNVSLEEKAANLFYDVIKNRPFVDGNKRIASLLFVVLLIENNFLYDAKGERKFNDSGLIALALLVEETKPSEKPIIVKLITNLVSKK